MVICLAKPAYLYVLFVAMATTEAAERAETWRSVPGWQSSAALVTTSRSHLLCASFCLQFPGCTGYCWDNQTKHNCLLQDSLNTTSSAPASTNLRCYLRLNPDVPVPVTTPAPVRTSCQAYRDAEQVTSGLYVLDLGDGGPTLTVWCEMNIQGRAWAVIQRRHNGSVNFQARTWNECAAGFGQLTGEFYLGNDVIHRLTSVGMRDLVVVLGDWEGNKAWAQYSSFQVDSAANKYAMNVDGGSYTGDAGDSLSANSGRPFTTVDQDNDACGCQCAVSWGGPWWHNACGKAKINGPYKNAGPGAPYDNAVIWNTWKGSYYSLKTTLMALAFP